jgi:hypothetical protein
MSMCCIQATAFEGVILPVNDSSMRNTCETVMNADMNFLVCTHVLVGLAVGLTRTPGTN